VHVLPDTHSRVEHTAEGHLLSALPSLATCKVASNSNLRKTGTTQAVLKVIRP
jgi:hypothetical protein